MNSRMICSIFQLTLTVQWVDLDWFQDKSSICSSEKHLAELDLKPFWILMMTIMKFLGQLQLSYFKIK